MSATGNRQTTATPPASALAGEPIYEACDQCSAPVDATQRYCVVCGTRRKHVYDPAARFLSDATSRSRSLAGQPRRAPARKRGSFSLGVAVVLVAIPFAVGVGVLVGRTGNGTDAKLLAALKAQQPTVVNVGGAAASGGSTAAAGSAAPASAAAGTAAPASTAATPPSSDYGLQRGFAIQLQTIPGTGATRAGVATVEQSAKAKGATAVGLITQADVRIMPSPPAGDDVIFSGQYKTRSAADSALARLERRFPAAKVIAVRSSTASAPGKVLATSSYGSAHQVSGFKPTASQLATGRQVAGKTAKELNNNYVQSQKGLPDQVSIP
jgi:hypothetical protein